MGKKPSQTHALMKGGMKTVCQGRATFIQSEGNILPERYMAAIGLILCRIGIHRWGRKRGYNEYSSNVIEWEQQCVRCGKRRRWIEAKQGRRR